jgi:hypothetical protein
MRNFFALCVMAGCTAEQPANHWVKDFNPGTLEAGYQRFVSPIIKDIKPGADAEWCQYLQGPSDKPIDIIDLVGYQSATGHHAVMYATTDNSYPVGESHLCTEDDMLHISFLGAVGGEGTATAAARLPDGLFFQLPAGHSLLANTHWVNATQDTVDGQAVFDVKFAQSDGSRQIADLFANNGDTFTIQPGVHTTFDVTCPIGADLSLAMSTNHMHWHGTSAYTEIIHADGSKQMLVQDDSWTSDEQFNPKYNRFGVANAVKIVAGDKYHTHCEWDNATGSPLAFPSEMCDGVSFYFPSQGQITCSDGFWSM